MLRTQIIFTFMLFATTLAWADSPQISLGFNVNMVDGASYARQLGAYKNPLLYGAYPQAAAPNGAGEGFAQHMQLISYFEGLPPSVQSNGLWVKRMARALWREEDAERVAALTQIAQKKSLLLYLCEPIQSKHRSTGLVAWSCIKASPAGDSTTVVCEVQIGKPNPSRLSVWECAEPER